MSDQSAIRVAEKPFALMGIVNVTPDSFYDGGWHGTSETAVNHALKLRDDGADIIDIGGASSRPGASEVSAEEELKRVIPVVERVAREFHGPISVDTTWACVADAALQSGATWINDISAGRFDKEIITTVAKHKARIVLMHSRGTPQTMQVNPQYADVVGEVKDELLGAVERFMEGGVERDKIILDPGFGFAKTAWHNLELLRGLDSIASLGFEILIGTSRKMFIGKITGRGVQERLAGTLGTVASAFLRGARIFRVHDVGETKDFLKVFSVIESDTKLDYFNVIS